MQRILVTGATGFVGTALTRGLLRHGFHVRAATRAQPTSPDLAGAEWFRIPDLVLGPDWASALEGMDGVVHLAGLAHRSSTIRKGDWQRYDEINHRVTRRLAQAISDERGVKRFVFVSSVSVHGSAPAKLPVTSDSPITPLTPYGKSKVDAERAVGELLDPNLVAWAILRPVLIYGPGHRGNIARLESLLRHGVPIPIGPTPNSRSLLFIGNLVDAIISYLSAAHPPSGKTWILADPDPISTEQLVETIASNMGARPRFIRVPKAILSFSATIGDVFSAVWLPAPWTSDIYEKLLGNFFVDSSPIMRELNWTPPYATRTAMSLTFRPLSVS
jgi:nucleoside-diphosphate-sugar epimerase